MCEYLSKCNEPAAEGEEERWDGDFPKKDRTEKHTPLPPADNCVCECVSVCEEKQMSKRKSGRHLEREERDCWFGY